jgi:hypothetical protein
MGSIKEIALSCSIPTKDLAVLRLLLGCVQYDWIPSEKVRILMPKSLDASVLNHMTCEGERKVGVNKLRLKWSRFEYCIVLTCTVVWSLANKRIKKDKSHSLWLQ